MDGKTLQLELTSFPKRLKQLRDQYSDQADSARYVEVEDKARRAYTQLGHAQDSLENLAIELARAEKHITALVKSERSFNAKRKKNGEEELTTCHMVLRDFSASNLSKLK
ncbi:hypothetical protein NX784_28650 [Massilia pinisoli]|uniref:Uncharacterized protein n=1 Tax=Massilia pinisoli TaxID=1772194 RepID=A0ABT2A038_9BURK|nr:hypothetical protein [Massilia pinisoli]MCS0585555.1 hypothetical protein [Massilia pinisoli]